MIEYKCPYCGQNSYNKNSRKSGKFTSWKAVRYHVPKCKNNTSEYFIDLNEGPLHYKEFIGYNEYQLRQKFSKLNSSLKSIRKTFKLKNILLETFIINWNKDKIINSIKKFYNIHNKIPQQRDLYKSGGNYPTHCTIQEHFGTFNKAIEAAGYEPNFNSGYGISTLAKDGYLYRSGYEAIFVNKFLFNKYEYKIEPKYPNSRKLYDWYIPELDLYIELAGGLRPEVIKEKIEINIKLNRNLLVVYPKDLDKFNNLEEFCYKRETR